MMPSAILPQLQRVAGLHGQGRDREAWPVIAPLRAAIGKDLEGLRLYALVAQGAGRTDEAVEALQQIARLQGDPPAIIGAIADVLSNAGRFEEALDYWDRLADHYPAIADAHLNRAITANDARLYDRSVEAADFGLKHFPEHPRLLAIKALALKNRGEATESLPWFRRAIAAEPGRALTHHNLGVALRAACRYDEACEAFAKAEALGLRGAQHHANWAAAALEAGKVDEAAALYDLALTEDPGHQETLRALTRLDIEYRDGTHAFSHYERSLDARGWPVGAVIEWANVLVTHKKVAAAAEVIDRGLKRHPDDHGLRYARVFTAGMMGDAGPPLDELESALAERPGDPQLLSSVRVLALRAKRFERAAELLELAVKANPGDQVSWASLSIVWRMLDDPREHWLCDYERLVMVTEVPSPDGLVQPKDYARQVAAALEPLHVTKAAPGDQTLRGGTQTSGMLFSRPDPQIQQFREAVLAAARKEVMRLPDDPSHPFLSRKSNRLGFSGSWSVKLLAGGHHVPHYHSQGWMSSAYYARLPWGQDKPAEGHEGWIQFGVPPDDFDLHLSPRRIVQPEPGRLVLFPSYMWHGTIPFQEGDRLTAAFDYQPV